MDETFSITPVSEPSNCLAVGNESNKLKQIILNYVVRKNCLL